MKGMKGIKRMKKSALQKSTLWLALGMALSMPLAMPASTTST